MVHEITAANFDTLVLQNEKPVLVDFWASWCGPCKMMGPVVDNLADEMADKLVVGKINVDEQPALAQKFGVMSIPTLALFQNGKLQKTALGFMPKQKLLEALGL
ncbi:MAG: thioredoxin [Pygmaiobacter massiliensis]|jgi:thioredoxin 1|nr:thioredoxin [Pygmaiobacter massiliensis]